MNTGNRKTAIRLLIAFGLVFALAFTGVQKARAMEIDGDGVVGADEVIEDDLFLYDETVTMAGTINGNLMAFGNTVTVSGVVDGDLIVGGGRLNITGTVNGNVFAVGGDVTIDGKVQDSLFFGGNSVKLGSNAVVESNLYAAAFSVNLQAGSSVARDIAVGGYQAILSGEIGRDARAWVGAFQLEGTVGRNVIVDVSEPNENVEDYSWAGTTPFSHIPRIIPVGLHVTSDAVIGGKLEYHSAVEQSAGIQAAPEGGVEYQYRPPRNEQDIRDEINTRVYIRTVDLSGIYLNYMFGMVREFLTLLLLGALAVWLIPSLLTRTAGVLRAKPLPSIGWGILVFCVGLLLMGMALMAVFMLSLGVSVVTLFGLGFAIGGIGFSAIGLATGVFFALFLYGSKLVVALLVGDWTLRLFRKDYSAGIFWPLLLGILAIVIADAIPCLGFLAGAVVIFFGFGAIWLVFRDWWQARRAKA
jgi:hypothetical protein